MIFEHLNLKPRNPYFSLALEEALCMYLAKQGPTGFIGGMRLWACPSSVILGRTCNIVDNITKKAIANSQVDHSFFHHKKLHVCRRLSGGGTVVHGLGNMNYSIYLSLSRFSHLYNVTRSYKDLLHIVIRALESQGILVKQRGLSDLVVENDGQEYKISGNSQFRKHGVIVLHGTLIMRSDTIDLINEHLLHPPKEPDYREGRVHASFLGTLPDHFDVAAFYECFRSEFSSLTGVKTPGLISAPDLRKLYGKAKQLSRHIYTHPDWVFRADAKGGRSALKKFGMVNF